MQSNNCLYGLDTALLDPRHLGVGDGSWNQSPMNGEGELSVESKIMELIEVGSRMVNLRDQCCKMLKGCTIPIENKKSSRKPLHNMMASINKKFHIFKFLRRLVLNVFTTKK